VGAQCIRLIKKKEEEKRGKKEEQLKESIAPPRG
jgi:hypothetical protein